MGNLKTAGTRDAVSSAEATSRTAGTVPHGALLREEERVERHGSAVGFRDGDGLTAIVSIIHPTNLHIQGSRFRVHAAIVPGHDSPHKP
jgi:hypothetical protein